MTSLTRRNWLEKALQSSPSFSATSDVQITEGDEPPHDPRFSKIVEGLIFTKKLVLTYHAVILCVIVIFALIHWYGKFRGARKSREKARKAKADLEHSGSPNKIPGENGKGITKDGFLVKQTERDGSSSSGSSTMDGNSTPLLKDDLDDDNIPLLQKPSPSKSKGGLLSLLHSKLIYQPPPIPILNEALPSNGTSLVLLCFIGLNLFYLFYKCPLHISMLFVFADRAGMLFVANLPLLYLLGAKNQPIKFLTGYSYESLNIVHRRLGVVLCLYALLHTVGMFGVWYIVLRPAHLNLWWFLTRKIVLLGLPAFIFYEVLYLTSLASFRQRWYELFLVTHVVLQAGALILLWFHHPQARVYVGTALAIFLIDRLVFRLALKTRSLRASLTLLEDGSSVKVSAAWPIRPRNSLRRLFGLTQNYKFGWKPTEHVFLTVPSLSRKHVIQAHPFTIASAAPSSDDEKAELDLVIRAQDGFSKDLVEFARHTASATVRLDGPYGSQQALDTLRNSDVAVVVAGGSGVAVAYPLVCALLEGAPSSAADAENGQRTLFASRKICFVWIVHHRSHLSWLGDEKIDGLKKAGVHVLLTPPTAEAGRPDVANVIEAWVHSHAAAESIGVVCSGPDGMNRAVRNACAGMVAKGRKVSVEIEKFGW